MLRPRSPGPRRGPSRVARAATRSVASRRAMVPSGPRIVVGSNGSIPQRILPSESARIAAVLMSGPPPRLVGAAGIVLGPADSDDLAVRRPSRRRPRGGARSGRWTAPRRSRRGRRWASWGRSRRRRRRASSSRAPGSSRFILITATARRNSPSLPGGTCLFWRRYSSPGAGRVRRRSAGSSPVAEARKKARRAASGVSFDSGGGAMTMAAATTAAASAAAIARARSFRRRRRRRGRPGRRRGTKPRAIRPGPTAHERPRSSRRPFCSASSRARRPATVGGGLAAGDDRTGIDPPQAGDAPHVGRDRRVVGQEHDAVVADLLGPDREGHAAGQRQHVAGPQPLQFLLRSDRPVQSRGTGAGEVFAVEEPCEIPLRQRQGEPPERLGVARDEGDVERVIGGLGRLLAVLDLLDGPWRRPER